MEVATTIVNKMKTLQATFKATKHFVEQESDFNNTIAYLEDQPTEFISIAYEAAAMAFAEKDLIEGEHVNLWKTFMKDHGWKHATQIHVGLGWALGQQRLDPTPYLVDLEPLLAWRVWDGYGYYDGFFRKRKAIQGILPEGISDKALMVYTQGLGRSLWYTCKGNMTKLQKLIDSFSEERKSDLWRGIGIASTYVGGGTVSFWNDLWQMAQHYQPQLAAGAALAIKSRVAANTVVDDTKLMAKEWCRLTISQIVILLDDKANSAINAAPWAYHTWVAKIDKEFNKN